MTDRFNALIVVLDADMRDDDAESLMAAIRHMKGVCDVKGNVSDFSDAIAQSRVRSQLITELYGVLSKA